MNIIFQGDSITDALRNRACEVPNRSLGDGYVTFLAAKICADNIKQDINIYNKAIGGDMTTDIYARWQKDTLSIDFDVLSLLCGINDIGFRKRLNIGNSIEKFGFVYERLLFEAREARPDSTIILMAPFIFKMHDLNGEFGSDIYENFSEWENDIKKEGEIIQRLSEKYNTLFIPLMDIFENLCKEIPAEKFSFDCIHPTPAGNYIIAKEWLAAANKNNIFGKSE